MSRMSDLDCEIRATATKPERRYCQNANVRIVGEGDAPKQLVGYAALFDTPSVPMRSYRDGRVITFVEVVKRGAFTNAIRTDDIKANVQHEGGLSVIGRTGNGSLSLAENEVGLLATITPPDTGAGRDALTLVRGKFLDQMSWAWSGQRDEWFPPPDNDPKGFWKRELHEIRGMQDVAVVSDPAYPLTTVEARAIPDSVWERAVNADEVPGLSVELAEKMCLTS